MSKMLYLLLTILLAASVSLGSPPEIRQRADFETTLTTTVEATVTFSLETTHEVSLPTFSTPTSSTTSSVCNATEPARPTYTATEVYAFNPDSPIHLLPFQAAGLVFRLGGSNAAYCPIFAERNGGCGNTNITTMTGCALSTWVPGGQAVYLAPDGSLRYTQPHSQFTLPGSLICPMSFTKMRDSDASDVKVSGFDSTGFMACPMLSSTRVRQQWQVYANTVNASVPLRHNNSSECWDFRAVGVERTLDSSSIAWEYV